MSARHLSLSPTGLRFGFRQIRAFVCLADDLHFSRAAGRLCMTQPALSRMIRKLERSVGLDLLERSTRRVRLTPAGEAFVADCRLALGYLDLACTAAHNAAAGRASQLRVAYTDFAIDGRLPEILQTLRAKAAGVTIDLKYMPTTAQQVALTEGRIDVGFITGEFRAKGVEKLLVDEQDFVLVLPEGHRLATQASVKLSELTREPFVIGTEDSFASFRKLLFELCAIDGFYPNVVQEVPDKNGILGLVAAGAGITIYAGSARNVQRNGIVVKNIIGARKKVPIFAAWMADHSSEALHRLLMIVNAQRSPVALTS